MPCTSAVHVCATGRWALPRAPGAAIAWTCCAPHRGGGDSAHSCWSPAARRRDRWWRDEVAPWPTTSPLRGVRVTVLKHGEVTSGTTGRHHGLLHSGARYAVADADVRRRVRHREPDPAHGSRRAPLSSTTACSWLSPTRTWRTCRASSRRATRAASPPRCSPPRRRCAANPASTRTSTGGRPIPDGTMDAMRLPLRFFATAQQHGAVIRTYTQVVGLRRSDGTVTGVEYRDDVTGEEGRISADLVVNATGPWAQRIADMAGVEVPVRCSPGVLVAVQAARTPWWSTGCTNPATATSSSRGRGLCVIGTSSWVVDDPDELHLPEDHIRTMITEGSKLVPAVGPRRAAGGLVGGPAVDRRRRQPDGPRALTHLQVLRPRRARRRGERSVTISGGKATTLRAMAEATADVVCRKLGIDAPCRTREYPPARAHRLLHVARRRAAHRTDRRHAPAHGARRGEPTHPRSHRGPEPPSAGVEVEAGLAASPRWSSTTYRSSPAPRCSTRCAASGGTATRP